MTIQPLAEVFGFPIDNHSERAERYRRHRLCPFNNHVANCTKDKANDPLGVCSVFDTAGQLAVTCPVRFRQDWLIAEDAARFFFPVDSAWTSLTEVRLNDIHGVSAGNIDLVLVAYDGRGRVLDFGSLEVQAVYISGNVRRPFEHFMEAPHTYAQSDWAIHRHRPRPDYLSSSRKRLVPQMLYKGTILKSWGKKQAVALHRGFFETLPPLTSVEPHEADIAWLIYDLVLDTTTQQYALQLYRTVYTQFESVLNQIITPTAGDISDFMAHLQQKFDERFDGDSHSPDAPSLDELL